MKLREKSLDECIKIIDRELPAMINECIKHFITAPYCEHSTWEQLVGDSENDSNQQTQAATKIIQNSINNKISFDFLLGQFLSIFKTDMWRSNLNAINLDLIKDTRVMSNIYNTFSHNIIFAKAFSSLISFCKRSFLKLN